MSNPSKARGTRWESDCERSAKAWWPWIERRALQGADDKGDLFHPTATFQCKDNPKEHISDVGMLREVDQQMANAGTDLGFVWRKTRGKSDPLEGVCLIRPAILFELMRKAGY